MRCPNCGVEDTKVVDSRPFEDGRCIRRRRVCPNCGNKFFTYETAESTPLMVVKKDKSRQVFSREKLMNGVLKSCHKRPVSSAQIETLVRDVENTIKATGKKEVPSGEIGRLVMERLKDIDDIAYVRFASVYREFRDVETFLAELQEIKDEKTAK
ncbi:MAG: transcriptional repressor NrdR [Clostridia bacterium]|nr:transcriptional repressor NrdR [Clostridia bacterium]